MMGFVVTGDMVARCRETIHAAEVFHDKAPTIARTCDDAAPGEIVIAVVERNHVFGGAWALARAQSAEKISSLEAGGWTLIFSPGAAVGEVEERSLTLARLAFKRGETLRRWASKHA